MGKYNIVVIGGGSAGLMVAAGAAGLGARVALVESRKMGGDCLNFGCIPSKALISSANALWRVRKGGLGLPPVKLDHSWPDISGRVRAIIESIAPHDSVERFTELGVDVFLGRGTLLSGEEVEITLPEGGSRKVRGKSVVIATGSSPAIPSIPGLLEAGFLTNETVFTVAEQPRRLLVMGGGPIGCELSQSFARLGSEVTLVEYEDSLLNREDEDASSLIAKALEESGVRLITGHEVVRVEKEGRGKKVFFQGRAGENEGEDSVLVDEILVAAGRSPNIEGLGLENAGISHQKTGIITNQRLQTDMRTVYACGDVVGPFLFTHMANQQARVVIQNALMPVKTKIDYRVVPWTTFTDPEVARVGLNEKEAKKGNIPCRVIRVPFSQIDRAICEGDTQGFLKVLTPPGKDDILGVTLVGSHAGDLVHEMVLAMQAKIGLGAIAGMVHVYPTRAEIFRRAADESRKAAFTPKFRAFLQSYLSWRRR